MSLYRERGRLHLSKIEEFVAFALKRGWERQPTKGIYEVLRLKRPDYKAPLIFYARSRSDHATEHQLAANNLVQRFIRDGRNKRKEQHETRRL